MLTGMPAPHNQLAYWNSTGATKTFTHPIDLTWLADLPDRARILDYGCGYGRLAGLLHSHGTGHVEGADTAPALIDRARQQHPGLTFHLLDNPPQLPHPDASIDAVVLFAVLTCIPTDEGQRQLAAELHRVLRPGGIAYISDLCLQDDQRNINRYQQFAATYGTYGVFETSDGAICRHHTLAWLHELLRDFAVTTTREITVDTMNGHSVKATQLLATKPPPRHLTAISPRRTQPGSPCLTSPSTDYPK
jgi:SAM-dependent methyltransferase